MVTGPCDSVDRNSRKAWVACHKHSCGRNRCKQAKFDIVVFIVFQEYLASSFSPTYSVKGKKMLKMSSFRTYLKIIKIGEGAPFV